MINLYDEQEKLITVMLLVMDILLFGLAQRVTYALSSLLFPEMLSSIIEGGRYLIVLPSSAIVYFGCFIIFDFYTTFRHQTLEQVFSKTLTGIIFATMALVTFLFLIDAHEFNRTIIGLFSFCTLLLLSTSRVLVYVFLKYYRRKGYNYKNVLIVGSKTRAQEMIDAIFRNPGSGYRVIGCLELDSTAVGSVVRHNVQVIGTLKSSFQDIVMNQEIDELVFAIPLNEVENGHDYVTLAEEAGVSIRVLPDWQIQKMTYHPGTASIFFDQFLGLPTLALSSLPQKETELLIKGAMDYIGATIFLILLSPVFLLTAIAIKLTSPGPVFFTQVRCGLNGKKFNLYKFRSMIIGADRVKTQLESLNEADGPVFKMKNDPRLTSIGRFIRMTSIDELPQLFNVLKGDMGLVGPRPPLPNEVTLYKPWQRRRLSLKPGLTCIWQVSARNNTDFETWMRLDLEYIDQWSLFLDLKLLFLTIPAVFLATGR